MYFEILVVINSVYKGQRDNPIKRIRFRHVINTFVEESFWGHSSVFEMVEYDTRKFYLVSKELIFGWDCITLRIRSHKSIKIIVLNVSSTSPIKWTINHLMANELLSRQTWHRSKLASYLNDTYNAVATSYISVRSPLSDAGAVTLMNDWMKEQWYSRKRL